MTRIEVLECDVARAISLEFFSHANKGYKICNVTNDGWLHLDGLAIKWGQLVRMQGQSDEHLLGINDCCVPLL